ncbi:MAG TPA: 2-C-methyl-D-erythritol 2,4-cyclodiphosphate synthase [Spirochaetota bacterium]|nr:2-C-methyl-D-erythritol 2,4-cyclodiphosphate synthase [Spirochaetota bacterium]
MNADAIRVGTGFDVHPLCEGRPCVIGGVVMDHPRGLAGHSDADVLLHAIIDALLGASGLGDIGTLFPDSDAAYKDISSLTLLEKVYSGLKERGVAIINIDSVVICEEPKIAPSAGLMKRKISAALGGLDPKRIGIKGKTAEKLGFTGRKEGIAAQAVCLVRLG